MKNPFKKVWADMNLPAFRKSLTLNQLSDIRNDIESWERLGLTSSKIIDRLSRKYPPIKEKWKAERAYWTETKKLESRSIEEDSVEQGDKKFHIIPSPNACKLCLKVSGNGRKVFTMTDLEYQGHGIPPIHPNCYCVLVPIIDSKKR